MKVTLLNGVKKTQIGHVDLFEIGCQIRDSVDIQAIFECKKIKLEKGKRAYREAKVKFLRCFTPSGKFGQEFRTSKGVKYPIPPTKKGLLEYNGIVVLDYDGIEDTFALLALEEKVKSCKYTHMCFCSPSGEGYKVLVKTTNKDPEQHANVFKAVSTYYEQLTGIEGDKSGSNYNRLCFVSVDRKMLYNDESTVFEFQAKLFEQERQAEIERKKVASKQKKPVAPVNYGDLDDTTKAMNKVEQDGYSFVDGQRHEYRKQFSIQCVKYGIPIDVCMNFVETNLVTIEMDIKKALNVVHWAYENIKEVGIYNTWNKENGKGASAAYSSKNKKEYKPGLFKESKEDKPTFQLPELSHEEINELPSEIKKAVYHQKKVEEVLNEYYEFRINTLKSHEEYRIKVNGKGQGRFKEIDKKEYNQISRSLMHLGVKCGSAKLESIILSDFSKSVHPLKERFEGWGRSLGEDKHDYIAEVASFVKTDAPKNLFLNMFKKWLVASVANVFVENYCTNHHCLILCGEQETNKTTFFTSLFSTEYVFSGHIDFRNKDSMILLTDTFLVLLDEQFSVLSKESEWETLKSMVTMPRVKARWHYAKTSKLAPRIANFCGTANRIEILQDDTGNRRFIPFRLIEPININGLNKVDIRKMWAQAYQLYKSNYFYLPTAKEKGQINQYQQGFKKLANEHYLIMRLYNPTDNKEKSDYLSSTEIWEYLVKHYTLSNDVTITKIGRAMKFLNFKQKNFARPSDNKKGRYWQVEISE